MSGKCNEEILIVDGISKNIKTPDEWSGVLNLFAGNDNMFLVRLLVFFLFELSFLLESMFGFLFLLFLGLILFTCVTHGCSPFGNSLGVCDAF